MTENFPLQKSAKYPTILENDLQAQSLTIQQKIL